MVCIDSRRAEATRTLGYGEALIHEECFRRKLKNGNEAREYERTIEVGKSRCE